MIPQHTLVVKMWLSQYLEPVFTLKFCSILNLLPKSSGRQTCQQEEPPRTEGSDSHPAPSTWQGLQAFHNTQWAQLTFSKPVWCVRHDLLCLSGALAQGHRVVRSEQAVGKGPGTGLQSAHFLPPHRLPLRVSGSKYHEWGTLSRPWHLLRPQNPMEQELPCCQSH